MRDRPTGNWRHICVDMQRLFSEDTPWQVEWAGRILPKVVEMTAASAARTVFTRFIPPHHPEDMPGQWQGYYRKWWMMTLKHLPRERLDLLPELQAFTPPARVLDKKIYSPWMDGRLHARFQSDRVDTVVISGGETDICVLATVLGAVDLGYRVILLQDAVCSVSDSTHEASLKLLDSRFSAQAEVMTVDAFLQSLS